MSLDRRKDKRIHNELYVKLKSELLFAWGVLCDFSENGLFIKSTYDFTMGKPIDIELFMPDNINSLLKGVIRRKIELPDSHRKYGLGIELIEKDIVYRHFLRSLKGQTKTPLQKP